MTDPAASTFPVVTVVIKNVLASGMAPEADEIKALMPGVPLPVQKAYAVARQMYYTDLDSYTHAFRASGAPVRVRFDRTGDHSFELTRTS